MATRGRKPKPTMLKLLEGNPGKRPLNQKEAKPEQKAPRCPAWLEQEAKKEWRRMAKQLEHLGVLTLVDAAAFAGYCQAYACWKEAEEFITKHGTIFKTPSGYIQQVPQVSFRAYGYVRTSRDEDGKKESIVTQKKVIIDFAQQNGLELTAVFEDNNVSGYTLERDGLNRLKVNTSKKDWDFVVIMSLIEHRKIWP